MRHSVLYLYDLHPGENALITRISDEDVTMQAIRMGVFEGETVKCLVKVPSGPIVLSHGGMELALGRALAEKIEVQRTDGH
jgi:ferrous iron transport protein A